jgi:hypothetical protein
MRPSLYSAAALLAVTLAAGPARAANPQLTLTPWFPAYGQDVQISLRDLTWFPFVPATRYSRSGNTIDAEYEYTSTGFFEYRPDFAELPTSLGELPPGSYTVRARLTDLAYPDRAARTFAASFSVAAPDAAGIYPVPRYPSAYQAIEVVVKDDYQIDPASLKAAVSGNVIRVDYDYASDAPASGAAIAGLAPFAAAKIAALALAPGYYRLEGWGRERRGGAAERRLAKDLTVDATAIVVEYYASTLDHYFISAWQGEIAQLDANPGDGFKRTGQRFKAWLRQADAPAYAKPVCRFYASGPNSHFYTADPDECGSLKGLEAKQKADAQASGQKFQGWQFEAVAFYAIAPQNGACPGDTQPVYRDYNNRAQQNDSNHRFTVTPEMRSAMAKTWLEEGVAFCAALTPGG